MTMAKFKKIPDRSNTGMTAVPKFGVIFLSDNI